MFDHRRHCIVSLVGFIGEITMSQSQARPLCGTDNSVLGYLPTHSLQSSIRRRRGTSPAALNRLQACLQRSRAAIRSGVKAKKSSPRSILSFSVAIAIVSVVCISCSSREGERGRMRMLMRVSQRIA